MTSTVAVRRGLFSPTTTVAPARLVEAPPALPEAPLDGVQGNPLIGLRRLGVPLARPVAAPSADVPVVDPRAQARAASVELTAPHPDHPYARHVAHVHDELRARGLPTTADGVRVLVPDFPEHGEMVTRVVDGPVGLARGADVRLWFDDQDVPLPPGYKPSTRMDALAAERERLSLKAFKGEATVADYVKMGADGIEHNVHHARHALAKARGQLPSPPDGQTSIVNMSFGTSIARQADALAQYALTTPTGSPVRKGLERALGPDPHPTKVAGYFAQRIAAEQATPLRTQRMAAATALLQQDVATARGEGVLVVRAAGNDAARDAATKERYAADTVARVPGVLAVGATNVGFDPTSTKDDFVTTFSSPGHRGVAAPGQSIPIAPSPSRSVLEGLAGSIPGGVFGGGVLGGLLQMRARRPDDADGTSFAAPYVASTAALMVKANPSITPDQIESILKDPRVACDIEGSRDGHGAIDVVQAVQLARDLGAAR